jgi:hypothetical protein
MIRNKIGRNDLCHCNSGLKYKKCCLNSKQVKYITPEDMESFSAQTELKQKVKDHLPPEVRILDADSQMVKMSEVILEFASEMLRHSDTRTEKKQAIDIACLSWNLALIKETDHERYKKKLIFFLKQMGLKDADEKNEIQSLISDLVDKKIKEYSLIDRFIVEYQVKFKKDELMLHVASTFSPPENTSIE